jgi:peroxiredoxin
MDDQPTPRDSNKRFLVIACLALAVLTVMLTVQNFRLKSQLAAALNAVPASALKVGDTIPAFEIVDQQGNRTRLGFESDETTLLLVFSSTCGACRETIPVWNRLLAEGPASRVHVVGIQTDFPSGESAHSTAALSVPDLRFPVFGSAEPRAEPMSKFPVIPAAALVDGRGTVKAVWFGIPTDDAVSHLHRALSS